MGSRPAVATADEPGQRGEPRVERAPPDTSVTFGLKAERGVLGRERDRRPPAGARACELSGGGERGADCGRGERVDGKRPAKPGAFVGELDPGGGDVRERGQGCSEPELAVQLQRVGVPLLGESQGGGAAPNALARHRR